MTATLTRLGTLATRGYENYEQTEVGERVTTTHSIVGVTIRADADGMGMHLFGGEYRVAPNDGWYIERDCRPVADGGHWAHLVDADGRAVTELPTTDGPVALHRDREYLIRREPGLGWVLYEAR